MCRLSALFLLAACSSGPKPPYAEVALDQVRIASHSEEPNFQKAAAMVDFHDGPFASALLVVDLATTCFPFESAAQPPAGQSWPADCDAFDRNFELTLDEPGSGGGPPAVELMRAITPFGGPEHQEIDFTDVANGMPGKHTLQVMIPTYSDAAGRVSGSDGGWNVSATLVMTPGKAPRKVLAVLPLLNLSQTVSPSPSPVSFTVPAGVASSRIEYRATGHGGADDPSASCIGPAEEFCKRTHHVMVDGSELQPGLVPWRSDCARSCTLAHYAPASGGAGFDYCMENPCGDVSSVRAPRANWCPGTLTPPLTWDGPTAAGAHTLSYAIDGLYPGGTWRLSAVYFAYGDTLPP